MAEYIGINEIKNLTLMQKETLKRFWNPQKYDIVLLQECIDVENDTYKYLEYLILDIKVIPINENKINTYNPKREYEKHEYYDEILILQKILSVNIEEIQNDELIIEISKNDLLPLLNFNNLLNIILSDKLKNKIYLNETIGKMFINKDAQIVEKLIELIWKDLKKEL